MATTTRRPHGMGSSPDRRHAAAVPLVVGLAAALQLVVLVPFTVAAGLVAPLWAIVGLYLLWGVGAVALVTLARRRPLVTPLVPIVNGALLATAITLGEQLLGWTP